MATIEVIIDSEKAKDRRPQRVVAAIKQGEDDLEWVAGNGVSEFHICFAESPFASLYFNQTNYQSGPASLPPEVAAEDGYKVYKYGVQKTLTDGSVAIEDPRIIVW